MFRLCACGALLFAAVLLLSDDSRTLFAPAPVYSQQMTYAQSPVQFAQTLDGSYVIEDMYMPQMQPEMMQAPMEYVEIIEEAAPAEGAFANVAMLAIAGAAIGGAIGYSTKARANLKMSSWGLQEISPDGALVQRIEGQTRKTWKFTDVSKDRVQVALGSEGRPVHADVHLWLGPNYTPFSIKAYSEDGKLRPVQCLVGTKKKEITVEVKNVGMTDFPIKAAANYAKGPMAELPIAMPATTQGERVDGQALRSYPLSPTVKQLEVILNTEGRQLKARVELLNAPNNPKQTFEVYASDGELTSLCVCFDTPDEGNTVRILNLSPVEFPLNIHLNEK
jgi:hypothetical protein